MFTLTPKVPTTVPSRARSAAVLAAALALVACSDDSATGSVVGDATETRVMRDLQVTISEGQPLYNHLWYEDQRPAIHVVAPSTLTFDCPLHLQRYNRQFGGLVCEVSWDMFDAIRYRSSDDICSATETGEEARRVDREGDIDGNRCWKQAEGAGVRDDLVCARSCSGALSYEGAKTRLADALKSYDIYVGVEEASRTDRVEKSAPQVLLGRSGRRGGGVFTDLLICADPEASDCEYARVKSLRSGDREGAVACAAEMLIETEVDGRDAALVFCRLDRPEDVVDMVSVGGNDQSLSDVADAPVWVQVVDLYDFDDRSDRQRW